MRNVLRFIITLMLVLLDLKCNLCKSGDVGDEYQYICVCVPTLMLSRQSFFWQLNDFEPVTYKHLSNRRKKISKFIGLIFSKFVYMDNIDRYVILVRENVVTRSGRTIIRPTRLKL